MSRRTSRLLVGALIVAVLAGVVYGLVRDSVWAGVVQGVIYGAGFALVFAVSGRSATAMDGLSSRQRREVRLRMHNGEPVNDPKLAPALVEHANYILATPVLTKGGLIAGGVFLAFGVAASALATASFGPTGLMAGVPLFMIALVFGISLWLNGRRRDLIERSLRLTTERFGEVV